MAIAFIRISFLRNLYYFISSNNNMMPIAVADWPKAWTVLACSNGGVVGSNPTRGMNVCVCVHSDCVFLCG
jgi:hypothetical protein